MTVFRFLLPIALLSGAMPAQPPMIGYSAEAAARQRAIEQRYLAVPSAEEARKHHRFFTAEPHPAGSERNNELARHIAETWRQQGWEDVRLHQYDVLTSIPREVIVEMIEPERVRASLREDPYDGDPDTSNAAVSAAYLGMSASGDVTAPVVYAHSGNPEDYDWLARQGIDIKGRIALVRYSMPYSYRGFKAYTAEQRGAAGILIYSDPADDGFVRGPVYPDGVWGPESKIQRGAITYDFIVPGDPLTPGWASIPGARRLDMEEAPTLPRIIAAPLSWRDAKPLLERLDGPEAPDSWQGGLPFRYRVGGGRVKVRLKVDLDTALRPNFVVEARIPGSELPDEWIVMGNHRDAWEFGGIDPSSGTAAMMEVSRGLGELLKQGIRPRRTLVICSWDGEEVGLTGSTEWGEQFSAELRSRAVAYINVDSAVSGPDFQPSAVASFVPMLLEIMKELAEPRGGSLYDARRRLVLDGRPDETDVDPAHLVNTRIGSGSDHTVFLNHLGVPTIGLGFVQPHGVYHSMYDNFFWMNRFGDPGYRYHELMARLWGTLALRLANAELLPLDLTFYSRAVRGFVESLDAAHPDAQPHVDLQRVTARLSELDAAASEAMASMQAALARGRLDARAASRVNARLRQFEANWLNPDGIPGRPWFKHMLYAARYTYANLELPGLTEAIEQGDWLVARQQAAMLEQAIARNTAWLRAIPAELSQPPDRAGR